LNRIIKTVKPDEIYNLGAQSHVKVSFELPLYTSNADALGTLRVLEAVRGLGLKCKIYQASTSELYGDSKQKIMNEKTQFQPVSPYAVSKLYSYEMIKVYRNAYNLFACNGILFNHESPRRGETFVTRKITIGLKNFLKNGSSFQLGNLDSYRDWGHAKDYVEGMWLMLQQKKPIDLVLATGKTYKVRDFLEICMRKLKINFKKKVLSSKETYYDVNSKKVICETNKRLLRPNEVPYLKGDSSKARKILGWKPKINLKQLASEMLEEEFKN